MSGEATPIRSLSWEAPVIASMPKTAMTRSDTPAGYRRAFARQHLGDRTAEQRSGRRGQQFRARRVAIQVAAVTVHFKQQVRNGVQNRGMAGVGGTQGEQGLVGTVEILDPMADQRPVDRLGHEVGGP